MRLLSPVVAIGLAAVQLATYPGTIAGRVLKAGTAIERPLFNARLELTGRAGTRVVRSDLSGRFEFSNLPFGAYKLTVTCDGFVRQEFPKNIVLDRGRQAANIVFQLDAAPTAAGWVLDSYGLPISNVMVEALHRSYDVRGHPRLTRAATGITDDRGEYRIFWLDPGEYFFYASSPLPDDKESEPVRIVGPTYYPGVTTPDDAKGLRVDVGREIRADFRLRRDAALWSVNGETVEGVTAKSTTATVTLTPPAEDPNSSRYRAQSSATGRYGGHFSIDKVVPGSYIVIAKGTSGNQELTAIKRIVLRPLLVGIGYAITLQLSPPLSINGRLFLESREAVDLHEASIGLLSVDPDLPSPATGSARPDGQFALNGVVPGSYVLDISNLPKDLYLKAARFGADDILEMPLELDIKVAATPLQILLGSDGGRVQVSAYNSKGERQSGAQVVLVPDIARRHRREQYRVAPSDEDGRAVLRGIPPGTYTLFAWEQLEPNAYLNADYLRPYETLGVPVKIAPGDNPPVSVRWIPKD